MKDCQKQVTLFSEKFNKLLQSTVDEEKEEQKVDTQEKPQKISIQSKVNLSKTRSSLRKKRSISDRQSSVQVIKQKLFGNEVSPLVEMITTQQKRTYTRRIQNLDDSKLIKMLNLQEQYEKNRSFEKEDIYQIQRMKEQNDSLHRYKQYDLEPRQLIYETKLQVDYMKEMRDMDYILQKKQETMQNLPSARKLLKIDTYKVTKKNQQEKQLMSMLDREIKRNQITKSGRGKLTPIQERHYEQKIISSKDKSQIKRNYSHEAQGNIDQKNKQLFKGNSTLKQFPNLGNDEFLNNLKYDIDLILESDLLS